MSLDQLIHNYKLVRCNIKRTEKADILLSIYDLFYITDSFPYLQRIPERNGWHYCLSIDISWVRVPMGAYIYSAYFFFFAYFFYIFFFFGHCYYSANSTLSYFFTSYDALACSALIHIVLLSFSILYSLLLLFVCLSVFGNVTAIDVKYSTDEPEACVSQILFIVVGLSVAYYANRKRILFLILLRIL